jgi:hypothetical protein
MPYCGSKIGRPVSEKAREGIVRDNDNAHIYPAGEQFGTKVENVHSKHVASAGDLNLDPHTRSSQVVLTPINAADGFLNPATEGFECGVYFLSKPARSVYFLSLFDQELKTG